MERESGMQAGDDRAYGTVAEVAAAYGVSVDTIRRRLKRGELEARRETTPQGFRWLLPIPAPGETLPGHEQAITPALDSAAMIETLQRELQGRNEEIARLHALLEVQARALEAAVERPTLPAAVDPAGDTDGAAGAGDPAITHTATRWQWLRRWLGRE